MCTSNGCVQAKPAWPSDCTCCLGLIEHCVPSKQAADKPASSPLVSLTQACNLAQGVCVPLIVELAAVK